MNESNKELNNPSTIDSAKKIKLLLQSLKATYWIYDVESDSIVIDKAFKETFDFGIFKSTKLRDLIEEFSIIHPSDVMLFYREIEKTIKGKSLGTFSLRLRFNKDDNYKWCQLNNSVIYGEGGASTLLIAIQDISEDMNSMKKYTNISDRFECEAPENLAAYIINLTQNSLEKIISSNGYDYRKIVTAKKVYEYVNSCIIGSFNKDKHLKYHNVQSLLEMHNKGKTSVSYFTNYLFDNKVLWVKHIVSLLKNPINDDVMAFHIIKDASEEVHINQILDCVVKNHFDFLARVCLERDYCNLIVGQNYTPEENKQRYTWSIEEYVNFVYSHGDLEVPTADEYLFNLKEKLKDTDNLEYYFEFNDKGKTLRKQINLYKLDGVEKSVIVACSDITALSNADKERNEVLSHTLDLANQANQAKTKFLSAMSHDIRTPINAIVGMTNIALSNLKDDFQVAQSFRIIKDSSFHLLSLINEILEMSAIESGKYLVKNEPLNIERLITQVIERLNPIAQKKNIEIGFDNQVSNPHFLSDSLSLSRIVENIGSNAIKFTPVDGKVIISISETQTRSSSNLLTIQVKDSGVGIDQDKLDKIFDSFYRTGSVAKGGIEGTGLGLSITKGLVDSLGGSITVQSKKEVGTTFKVVVPIRRTEQSIEKKQSVLEDIETYDKLLENKNVLLVEDHPINALVAKKMLIYLGACVHLANDGLEGFNTFKKSSVNYYDVILMDLEMPIMDGYEATKKIRKLDRSDSNNIPIIAMTAKAFAKDVEKCLEGGMDAHISKPIEMYEVADKLRKFVCW